MTTETDTRQIVSRESLDRIAPDASVGTPAKTSDILKSVNSGVTPPLEIRASSTPDLVLNIGSNILADPILDFSRTAPLISNNLPDFAGGTITFSKPNATDLLATPSVGPAITMTQASDEFIKVGVYMNPAGDLVIQGGTAAATETAATLPTLIPGTLPIGYVVIQTIGNVIQPIENSEIYQYTGPSVTGSADSLPENNIFVGDASNALQPLDTTNLGDATVSSKVQEISGVELTGNTLTIIGHGLIRGQRVFLTNTGGDVPAPLAQNTPYFVINDTINTIKLGTTLANALNGTAVDITAGTSGGTSYIHSGGVVLKDLGLMQPGAVAINTVYSGAKLEVFDNGGSTSSSNMHAMISNQAGNVGDRALIAFKGLNTGGGGGYVGAAMGTIKTAATTRANDIVFYIADNDNLDLNNDERMRVTNNGDVGIGTTNPNKASHSVALTVSNIGSGGRAAIEIEGNGVNANGELNFYDNGLYASGLTNRSSGASGRLVISQNGVSTIEVRNGNVGIGSQPGSQRVLITSQADNAAVFTITNQSGTNGLLNLTNNGSGIGSAILDMAKNTEGGVHQYTARINSDGQSYLQGGGLRVGATGNAHTSTAKQNYIEIRGSSTSVNDSGQLQIGDNRAGSSRQFGIINGHNGSANTDGVTHFMLSDGVNEDAQDGDVIMSLSSSAVTYSEPIKLANPEGGTASDLEHYEEYSTLETFTLAGAGTTDTNVRMRVVRIGKLVTLTVDPVSLPGNGSSGNVITSGVNLPVRFRPSNFSVFIAIRSRVDGAPQVDPGYMQISTAGQVLIYRGALFPNWGTTSSQQGTFNRHSIAWILS